jgi:hypothetical protein
MRASDETYLGPPFYDPQAVFNGYVSAQLAVGTAPYAPVSGNPSDPSVALEGVGPAWLLQLGRLVHRIFAPFANAEYLRTLEPNVDIIVHYSSYLDGTFRMTGVIVSNGSDERLIVGNVLVEGAGSSQLIYPVAENTLGGFVGIPPSAAPGETVVVAFDTCAVEPIHGPGINVQLYLTTGERPLFSQWQVSWPGEAIQDQP